MEVGDKLKTIRKMHGLSQRELAKRVGLTNSTISMIESNAVSPSISSLKRILSGVSMSIPEFFTLNFEQQSQVVFRAEQLENSGSEAIELKLVGAPDKSSNLTFAIIQYRGAADSGTEMLSHSGEVAGTVLEGEIELTVGGTLYKLSPGDSYKFCAKLPHRFCNKTANPCKIVSAQVPAKI
ncbi:MAG: helix-turn-helix domain-containing protein [Pseudomonadales bacterium]|nr:helix-turn-helix domain-containing protein [Pseudomonadales bacterium]NRA18104.1 helix-turn-helix domain-containing protein [Oceanospirillaceae bacterium]